jgi:hypothetical protein
VCVWGGYNQVQIPDAQKHSLVLKQDLAAMEFIKSELPEDSQFLAEAMTVPSEYSIMGNDAGWWIPFYTLRQNNVPPRYAFLNEIPISPDYNQRMVTLVRTIELFPIPSLESKKLLCSEGITHLYIGQQQGQVSFGNDPLFTDDQLKDSPMFSLQFKKANVRIYQFDRSVCQ